MSCFRHINPSDLSLSEEEGSYVNTSTISDEVFCLQLPLGQRPPTLEACPPSPDDTTRWCPIVSDVDVDIIKINLIASLNF